MIPYVISVAYPDYKRPCVEHDYGIVKEEEMETYFSDEVSKFVLERTGNDDLSLQDINEFFDNYFEEYFMMNAPWSAMVFRNGEWENATPSNDQIWGHIRLLKLQEKEDKEKEEEETTLEHEEKFEIEEDEKLILIKMREFFEKMLKEKPLPPQHIESLQKFTELEQLSALFNIYLTTDNYNENKYLFQGFLNLSVKFIQKDIEQLTKKMETDESEELRKALEHALAAYSSAIFVKQTFNF